MVSQQWLMFKLEKEKANVMEENKNAEYLILCFER